MESIADCVGSNRFNLRRYGPVHRPCWPKGRLISDGQPQLEAQVSRPPTLELAYQAQLAACNYLGYSPPEFSTSQFRQQATISAASARPLELHMHHHHHHYVASPTSPFSQTGSTTYYGETGLVAKAADLSIRVDSPLSPPPTATSNMSPILGLHESPVASAYLPGIHPPKFVQNPSQGLLRSQAHSETNQKLQQHSVLCLKNQAAEGEVEQPYRLGQEVRGYSKVFKEGRLVRRDSRSPMSNTSEHRSEKYGNKLSWSRDCDSEQQQHSEREVPDCRQTFAPSRKSDTNSFTATRRQKDTGRGGNQSPYGSFSEENSATEESITPTINEPRPTSQKAFQGVIDPWKARFIHGIKEDTGFIVKPSTLERHGSQATERPVASERMGTNTASQPHSNGVNGEASGSSNTVYEDTTSSAGKDSLSSSEKLSGLSCNWACGSRSESKSQKNEHFPPTKAARKNFGARASRRQASREARGWESKDMRTSKSSCHAEARDREKNNHPCIYELESQKEVGQKDVRRCNSEREGNLSSSIRGTDNSDWRDADKFKVQKIERKIRLQPEMDRTRKYAENVEFVETAPLEEKGIVEDIFDEDDRRGTDRLKSEYLQDAMWSTSFYTPWTDETKATQTSSQNRFREAVEAAWKTSLGTKSEPQSDDLNSEIISEVGGASQESLQGILNSQIVARVAAEQKACAYEASAKVAEEGLRGLLDERALFRAKFKEEVEQGVTDRLRLQEQLQLEKFKLEATERELREVKRSFKESSVAGVKVNEKRISEPRPEHPPMHALITPGVPGGRDHTHLKLLSESEARIAAEAKASYFEASAKAAEEQIRSLLKEKNCVYSKYKEELEQISTETTELPQLMELDKSHQENTELPQSMKLDVRAVVTSNVADKTPNDVAEDGNRVAQTGNHDRASFQARLMQELEQEDADRQRLHRLLELEEKRAELVKEMEEKRSLSLPNACTKQGTLPIFAAEIGKEREFERNPPSSLAANGDNKKQLACASLENSNPKNDKERPLSPTCSSRVQKWTPDMPFSVKIERCSLEDGQTITTFDISPNFVAFDPGENSPNFSGCKVDESMKFDTESSSDFDVQVSDDEKLVDRTVRSYRYDMSGQQIEHPDAEGEENEEAKSLGVESDTERTLVDRRVRSYHKNGPIKPKQQNDLSAGESPGTNMFGEEHNAYESESSEKNIIPRAEGNSKRQNGSDRHGKHAGRGEGNLSIKIVNEDNDGFDDHLMLLPSRWKKAAKAELRKIIQEQELTWKIAEDAMAELGRRLELLERYKMELQDNLGRSRARNDIDTVSTRLEERYEGSPGGFSSLYQSPIFDDRLGILERETSGRMSTQADLSDTKAHERHQSNDMEIQKLKADIADLKSQLRRSSRDRSPQMKEDFRYSSSSSPSTPPLPPPPATPATPPTPPAVPDYPKYQQHAFQECSNERQVPLVSGSETFGTGTEVDVGVLEAEKVEAQAENVKIQAAENNRNGHLKREVDRHQNDEDSLSDESLMENRSWVPIPDDESVDKGCWLTNNIHENGERNRWVTGHKFSVVKSSRLLHQCRRGSGNDNIMSCKLSSDEGELDVFKDSVRKLSNIFWEQEGKLKNFKGEVNMAEADPSQSLQMRRFYVDLLKEMSQQLGELCRDLQTESYENVNDHRTMVRPLVGASEVENLKATLEAAERHIDEEVNINRLLQEKLDAGDKHLSKVLEEHAEELLRKEKTVSFAQQLNLQLASEMSVTESSLAELRARYKGLVANLESQLKDARDEVTSLQGTLSDLKLEVEKNQSLVLDLERAGQKKELQIQELTRRMQAYQSETDQTSVEKLELLKNTQDLRREAEDQQRRVVELVNINDELLQFAQSKEDEVKALTKEVTSLQRVSQGKSDEANKLAVEAAMALQELTDARKDGESYRLRCKFLTSKLEETEQELMAREDALERLTCHLSSTIEGQDLISEEKEQLLLSLSKAQYKEHRMDDQVRQSKVIIQELEEKLSCMEEEISKARIAMTEMKVKGEESLAIKKEAGEMRSRVHQLEEEIMEKEGQISILKSSFPGEFDSTF